MAQVSMSGPLMTRRPPGASTRAISESARRGSPIISKTRTEEAASNELSGEGSSGASPPPNSTGAVDTAARARASAIIVPLKSTPTARAMGKLLANARTAPPVPQPTSRMRSPSTGLSASKRLRYWAGRSSRPKRGPSTSRMYWRGSASPSTAFQPSLTPLPAMTNVRLDGLPSGAVGDGELHILRALGELLVGVVVRLDHPAIGAFGQRLVRREGGGLEALADVGRGDARVLRVDAELVVGRVR